MSDKQSATRRHLTGFSLGAILVVVAVSGISAYTARRTQSLSSLVTNAEAKPSPAFLTRSWIKPLSIERSLATADKTGDKRSAMEVEIITVRPTGFEPAEIKRPRGSFFIAVHNQSGIRELSLRLDRENGSRLKEGRTPKYQRFWRSVVDLEPGRYVLTEANHPEWRTQITIISR